jgi:hypothetical protein
LTLVLAKIAAVAFAFGLAKSQRPKACFPARSLGLADDFLGI